MLYECNDVGEAPRDAVVALAGLLNSANRIAFLTGAGVSTDSGIPDFRSSTGVYQTTSAEIFAIDSFFEDPERFYSFFAPFYRDTIAARPNSGHLAIAALEKLCNKNVEVVTQNIDALHSAAGSSVVWEIHGTLRFASCMRCGKRYERDVFQDDMLAGRAPKCACGGVLKPDVVFFRRRIARSRVRRRATRHVGRESSDRRRHVPCRLSCRRPAARVRRGRAVCRTQ